MSREKELRDALDLLRKWWRMPEGIPARRQELQRETTLFLRPFGGIQGDTSLLLPGSGLCNPCHPLQQGDPLLAQKLVRKPEAENRQGNIAATNRKRRAKKKDD